jgi:superfamily II DNA/RNA helicase
MKIVARIVRKSYLTEMDLLRLRMSLLMCRMAANSTFLVDKQKPFFSTKLERLGEIFDDIAAERDRKVVLFSEWTTMLDLIEPLLNKSKLGYVRLDGSVPQKKRQALVSQFQSDKKTRVFLTTNAGSSGLNLQAANTVINVDLPWNPAVLEQRIARVHRMGQARPVSVFVLVTEQTLEESLLTTLSTKRDLAMAALDPDASAVEVDLRRQADDIKEKLEVLLGAKAEAPPADETAKELASRAVSNDRLAHVGSAFLRAAFDLLGEIAGSDGTKPDGVVEEVRAAFDAKVIADEQGKPRLSFALPSRETLSVLLRNVAGLLLGGSGDDRSRTPAPAGASRNGAQALN